MAREFAPRLTDTSIPAARRCAAARPINTSVGPPFSVEAGADVEEDREGRSSHCRSRRAVATLQSTHFRYRHRRPRGAPIDCTGRPTSRGVFFTGVFFTRAFFTGVFFTRAFFTRASGT
jgi:hypothetical protein